MTCHPYFTSYIREDVGSGCLARHEFKEAIADICKLISDCPWEWRWSREKRDQEGRDQFSKVNSCRQWSSVRTQRNICCSSRRHKGKRGRRTYLWCTGKTGKSVYAHRVDALRTGSWLWWSEILILKSVIGIPWSADKFHIIRLSVGGTAYVHSKLGS